MEAQRKGKWGSKNQSLKAKLNRRPQTKKEKPKREEIEVSLDEDKDGPSFFNADSELDMSYPQVTLGKIE